VPPVVSDPHGVVEGLRVPPVVSDLLSVAVFMRAAVWLAVHELAL
jgi:hypothetical protein